jgi:hypothetical protein
MNYKTIFIVGASRSGTTWLQHMLGIHHQIVTPQETDFFNLYIHPLWKAWNQDLQTTEEKRFKGLAAVLTQKDFDRLILHVISMVYQRIMELKPSASVLLEKNPPYSLHIDLINRYLPQAHFIHMIRDGRDVAASLMAASGGWGRSWAPNNVVHAAKMWKNYVLGARKAQYFVKRYIEVRYEDLLVDGPSELRRLFKFCNIETTLEECSAIYDRFTFTKMKSQTVFVESIKFAGEVRRRSEADLKEPGGFFREGKASTWKSLLGPRELWSFDQIAGDLLVDLGYAKRGWRQTRFLQDTMFSMQAAAGLCAQIIRKGLRLIISFRIESSRDYPETGK